MTKDKVTVIDGGRTPNLSAEAVRKMRTDLPVLVEYLQMTAELQKAKFDALRSQGFTEAQAIELSKSLF